MIENFFPSEHVDYDKGHGRIETRKIRCSTPFERITTNLNGEKFRKEIAYGITSLSTEKAKPEKLLDLVRGHIGVLKIAFIG